MSLPSTIITERLQLRQFEPRDLEPYLAYYTGPRTSGVGGPKPRYVVVERFMAMIGQWALRGYGRYAVTTGGAGFGHVGVMHIDDTDPAELTWTLWDEAEERKGYATEAARAVLDAWSGEPLLARVVPDNARSLAVAERLGMQETHDTPPPSYGGETRNFIDMGSTQ
jgi:RimJ/RimL family protein N-acetyltransferase